MRKNLIVAKAVVGILMCAGLAAVSFVVVAGPLDPPAAPAPTMHSIEEVYAAVSPPPAPLPPVGRGPLDIFMQVGGMEGESVDARHRRWIDVFSYGHGVSNRPVSAARPDPPKHSDFTITKRLDKSSPKLNLYCCNGNRIPQVIVEICRAGNDMGWVMRYVFDEVVITSVRPQALATVDNHWFEEVAFTYSKVEWRYREYDPSGKPVGEVVANWDVEAGSGG